MFCRFLICKTIKCIILFYKPKRFFSMEFVKYVVMVTKDWDKKYEEELV